MDEMQLVTALINSETRLAVIETGEQARVVDWFRDQFNVTGKASYQWTKQDGLRRIAIEHIPIPQTLHPTHVLEHILGSHHYGIYLLCDFQNALTDSAVRDKLDRLLNSIGPARKLVLLLGDRYKLPASLAARVERITLI